MASLQNSIPLHQATLESLSRPEASACKGLGAATTAAQQSAAVRSPGQAGPRGPANENFRAALSLGMGRQGWASVVSWRPGVLVRPAFKSRQVPAEMDFSALILLYSLPRGPLAMENMGSYSQAQWPGWAYNGDNNPYASYAQLPSYAAYLPESMELYNAHQRQLVRHHHMSRTTETKPRLSKEEVEVLESEFQKNHKPNSSTKKSLAESMRVDNARINNWFQNRRAREKKENNIREYAAKQKLEKDNATSESGGHSDNDRHNDLVASSAPFPDIRRPLRHHTREASLSSDLGTPEQDSETTETSQSDDFAAYSSPDASLQESPETSLILDDVGDIKAEYFSPDQDDEARDIYVHNSSREFLSMPEATHHMRSDELSLSQFPSYPQLVIPNDAGETTPSFSRHGFSGSHGNSVQEHFAQYHDSDYEDSNLVSVDSRSSMMSLKSPASIDIASRRNRRPPHLAINASRSYSAGVPRTGVDFGRRADTGNSMRRVASATGTVRISKVCGTPRSPFFDRNSEALYQLNRSPKFTGPTGTIAPPTPNTPVVLNQQGLCEATTMSMDGKFSSDLAMHDPTLRTPPTTPGLLDNIFTMDSAYDMTVSDEPLVTPGFGSFPTDFEIPGMSSTVPNYISNGCSSQPQTPLYNAQMGPTYFGFPGGNAEYNWSDASTSERSSPGQSQRHVQFMNMTPSNFTHVEK
ncbi:hypothetical protein G7046_g6491 [Stylonectria norvegica]|nr:hypothetical protein G7046_g6491 [Stylonectria norvegica]